MRLGQARRDGIAFVEAGERFKPVGSGGWDGEVPVEPAADGLFVQAELARQIRGGPAEGGEAFAEARGGHGAAISARVS